MKIRTQRTALVAVLAGAIAFGSSIVRADVTITRTTSVEGVGGMSFANMSGTSKTTISGDKSRTDSDMKMQSKLIGFLARNAVGPTADIILLGDDKVYRLNMNKKEYTETTFEEMRQQLQKATDQMNSGDERKQPSAVDQSKCEWLPGKVTVNKTGEKAQFAGYDADRAIITATQPCKDKESGSICEVAIILDQWMAPGFADSSETRKFYAAYAAKMGMDASTVQDASQRAKALFSQYKGLWSDVVTKMQGMKGYPVKTGFTLAMGGAQCKDNKAQQSSSSSSDDDSNSPGGLAGAMAGKLGGLFHKKSDSDAPAAAPAPTSTPVPVPAGDVSLMTVSSTLVSVSTDSVGAEIFSVPAGFKKVELKTQ